MSSIGKLMKQAARMQQQVQEVQARLAQQTVEATSGGGAVKVLANGELTKKLKVEAHGFSAAARARIEAAGGSCEVVAP